MWRQSRPLDGPRMCRGDHPQQRDNEMARTIFINRTPRLVGALRLIPSKARDPTAVRNAKVVEPLRGQIPLSRGRGVLPNKSQLNRHRSD